MNKKEYLAPELEVVKLNAPIVLQSASNIDGDGSTATEYGGDGTDLPN